MFTNLKDSPHFIMHKLNHYENVGYNDMIYLYDLSFNWNLGKVLPLDQLFDCLENLPVIPFYRVLLLKSRFY